MLTAKQPRPKKCRHCKEEFSPRASFQVACGVSCAVALNYAEKAKKLRHAERVGRQEQRAARERIKTRGDYAREAQAAFNAWIRLRDADQPCVSCGRHHQGKYDAGHYRTVGSSPELRFDPLNCHKQCVPCNQHKSGNVIEYRINLAKRIGADKVEWLEGPHEPRRYSIEDLKAIKSEYKEKSKQLKALQGP